MRPTVLPTLLTVLAAGVLLILLLRWLEPAMIYHPSGTPAATPRQAGLEYRDVVIGTEDGERLQGWWIPSRDPGAPVMLFFHGNAGSREHRLHNLEGLHRAGISVLIFDYRGYGGSSGKPSEEGLLLDGEAAFDWLREETGGKPVFIFGRSLGGAVAANVALRRKPAGLILESTFTNAPAMAIRVLPIPGIGYLTRSRFDTLAAVKKLTVPLLVIHGEADEIVPFAMGRALFEAATTQDKEFHAVPGAYHNDTYLTAGEAYYPWLTDFLQRAEK